jgi:uncharacterized protein YjbI with pentapeptide repeats
MVNYKMPQNLDKNETSANITSENTSNIKELDEKSLKKIEKLINFALENKDEITYLVTNKCYNPICWLIVVKLFFKSPCSVFTAMATTMGCGSCNPKILHIIKPLSKYPENLKKIINCYKTASYMPLLDEVIELSKQSEMKEFVKSTSQEITDIVKHMAINNKKLGDILSKYNITAEDLNSKLKPMLDDAGNLSKTKLFLTFGAGMFKRKATTSATSETVSVVSKAFSTERNEEYDEYFKQSLAKLEGNTTLDQFKNDGRYDFDKIIGELGDQSNQEFYRRFTHDAFNNASLYNIKLEHLVITNKALEFTRISQCSFDNSKLNNVDFTKVSFTEQITFNKTIIDPTTMQTLIFANNKAKEIPKRARVSFDGAIFVGDFSDMDFSGLLLRGADFTNARSSNINVGGAYLNDIIASDEQIINFKNTKDATFSPEKSQIKLDNKVKIIGEIAEDVMRRLAINDENLSKILKKAIEDSLTDYKSMDKDKLHNFSNKILHSFENNPDKTTPCNFVNYLTNELRGNNNIDVDVVNKAIDNSFKNIVFAEIGWNIAKKIQVTDEKQVISICKSMQTIYMELQEKGLSSKNFTCLIGNETEAAGTLIYTRTNGINPLSKGLALIFYNYLKRETTGSEALTGNKLKEELTAELIKTLDQSQS